MPSVLLWWACGDLARPMGGLNYLLPLLAAPCWSALTWRLQRDLPPRAATLLPLLTLVCLSAGYLPGAFTLPMDEEGWFTRAGAPLLVIGWGGLCWSLGALLVLSPPRPASLGRT